MKKPLTPKKLRDMFKKAEEKVAFLRIRKRKLWKRERDSAGRFK